MSIAQHTRRLLLRPLNEADADLYGQLYTDGGVMGHIATPLAPEAARRAFELARAQNVATPPRVRYWTGRRHGDAGGCGLLALSYDDESARSAEVGMMLLPHAQGKGFAVEALSWLADHAFGDLALERLWTRHRAEHRAAFRLMQVLGFEQLAAGGLAQCRWEMRREQWRRGLGLKTAFAMAPARH